MALFQAHHGPLKKAGRTLLFAVAGFGTVTIVFGISKNFWLSMIGRAYRPGCQVDNMIVLEGAQGIGKSAALRVIGAWRPRSRNVSPSMNSVAMKCPEPVSSIS